MSVNQLFIHNTTTGWRLGFKNLFKKESREWWRSRRWWVHLLIWIVIIDGLMASTLFGLQNIAAMSDEIITDAELLDTGLKTLFGVASLSLAIGMIIVTQDEFIGEKQNGTAAWTLSKPVSRIAFYLSKFTANFIPMILIMILPPLIVGYGILTFAGFEVSLSNYCLSGVLLFIHTLFFMTLSLLMGVVFSSRTALLAGTLGVLFGGQLLSGIIKFLTYVVPSALTQLMPIITLQGPGAIPTDLWITPVVSFGWSLVFIATALWRINHLEF